MPPGFKQGVSFNEVNEREQQGKTLSHNGHLCKMDTSAKRTLRVGPCLSLLLVFDSL